MRASILAYFIGTTVDHARRREGPASVQQEIQNLVSKGLSMAEGFPQQLGNDQVREDLGVTKRLMVDCSLTYD